ncbi:MAG: family 20 glycosylhydrolase [Clostridiales bacterium]|nr:family 20 glycosylhydrolase [Clostridiales bacterium]
MYLQRMYPKPAYFKEYDTEPFYFGSEITARLSGNVSDKIVEGMKELWNSFSFTASSLKVEKVKGDDFYILIGDRDVPAAGDYYTIASSAAGAALSAISEKALFDGFTTLVQLITPVELSEGNERLFVCPCDIKDKPTISFRSIHLCVFPECELYTIEKLIRLAGFLKLTHVVLEFWGVLKYDSNPYLGWSKSAFTKDQIRPLIKVAHSLGLEVIPMFNHFGHASQQRGAIGRHVTLNQNPRMQMLFEPDGWTWCLSNPNAIKLLGDIRDELCELCGNGDYFHIGCDEAYSFATCSKCASRVPYELYAEHINAITASLSKKGRRPIMWHDELINRSDFKCVDTVVANGHVHNTYPALDLLDKRVIIADWQYYYKTKDNPTTPYFIKKGFDTVLCPWDELPNVRALCDTCRDLGAYGVMLTTWHHLYGYIRLFTSVADMLWQGSDDNFDTVARMEAAAILRKVYPSDDFERSGWHPYEVLPYPEYLG